MLRFKKLNIPMLALFTFIILSWGLAWPINKLGLDYMTPGWYTAIRLTVGTLTMMLIVACAGKLSWPAPKDYPLIFIIGFLQISIYILLANLGLKYLPAGRASLLAYTTPLWVMPAVTFFFGEPAGARRWFGFAVGMLGLLILLSPWELDWTNQHILFGAGMLLLASLCWAISMLCARYMHWRKSPLELIPWQLLVGTIPIIIYSLIYEPTFTMHLHSNLVLSLLYTGVLVTGLSYWCGLIVNKELPTIIVSFGFLIVPIFSMIVSAIYFHETISALTIGAMSLILGGICFVAL